MNTAVVFIVFRRPDTTRRVFERIRKARPQRLYIIADGARPDRPEEVEKVLKTKEVVEEIDWPCEVTRIYSAVNLGCKNRIISGLDQVFETEEAAIILEDDCLPHMDFFRFCGELLERYADDKRVMHIGGNNFLRTKPKTSCSYWFSKYPHCWGWATWARAWKLRKTSIDEWDQSPVRNEILNRFMVEREATYWDNIFSRIQADARKNSSWVYLWTYTCWSQDAFSIYPLKNQVTNIGIGEDATHTVTAADFLEIKGRAIGELRHPPLYLSIEEADHQSFEVICEYKELRISRRLLSAIRIFSGRIIQNIKSIFPK